MKSDLLEQTAVSTAEVDDQCISIPSPFQMRQNLPLDENGQATVARARTEIGDILQGKDSERLLILCGPCSIDNVNSALVYAERFARLAEEVLDKALLVMRTYFEKPRSVVGWKGLLYDPMTEGERSPAAGIALARRLLARLTGSGVSCATEFLNPLLAPYLEDCMSYGSIGARTVESQIHRELASRLEMPIGLKNGMDGGLSSAVNAVRSAQSSHSFYSQDLHGCPALVSTQGNNGAHVILRGGSNGPNFDSKSVSNAVDAGRLLGLSRGVVVDCSHGNSGKDHRKQASVAMEVLRQKVAGQDGIAGIMLESNLVAGQQSANAGPRVFGQSITDACIGWKDTECLVRELAASL
ncbi:3-deoxy-7-phosphoheptulonate synthase [Pelagicoccus albus]|uniref:Phospho-2-dehydro-3-deoxyheptonate aldolase n=1 Tax=Pelagicoccus albus TaxID=415222 RepID=A0A7X1E768_9BACT|nr:3-deoxy-7-phosphoheptulonate synthase [Pelagicoccus albus]MBC2605420.1 3-deoxy-7-phosphoheptulonate synthase [Pelagicoccus albus]